MPLVEARLVDAEGAVLPWDGETTGELEVRGPWVASAYYEDPAGADCFHDGWLRTGDIAAIDAHGFIRISDRAKDVIKSGGEWISSVDLEGADGASGRGRGRRDRQARRALAGAPAGVRRAPPGGRRVGGRAGRAPGRPRGAGGFPTSSPSSTRCPRPASASSTRRRCAAPSRTAPWTTSARSWAAPSRRRRRRARGRRPRARRDASGGRPARARARARSGARVGTRGADQPR